MEEFSVDAKPSEGCELGGLPNRPFLAPASEKLGEENTKESNICARDPRTGKEQWYRISVSKLSGGETEVLGLHVKGAELVPPFDPSVRSYKAHMDVSHEFIQVAYVMLDNGQKVSWQASPEEAAVLPGDNRTAVPRRTGEDQHMLRHEIFPVDVGYGRKLTLTVESADPMQAARGLYFVEVTRGGCLDPQRPYFEPRSQSCTLECPQGTYPNREQSRCSYCNRHCAVCETLAICNLCDQDTIQHNFIIDKEDGTCKEVNNNFFKQYFWWCISGAVFGGLLLCFAVMSLCSYLCDTCCNRKRRVRHFDSDLD
eukprot:symbB.v1.2.026916.t1/scaffold2727.1/size72105/3